MVTSRRLFVAIATMVLLGSGAAWAVDQVQTPAKQKCINAMNKNGTKLHEAQCIDNRACIKDFGQGRLVNPMTAEDCLTADRLGKILKRQGKTSDHEGIFCTDPVPPVVPDFAYTGSATVNPAATQASIDMLHDLFGNPIQNGLFACNTAPNECYCQRFMSKWIHKYAATMPRVFRKCKKAALKVGKDPFPNGAMSAAEVQSCWDGSLGNNLISVAANPNNQLGKILANLSAEYQNYCVAQGVDDDVFPGCAPLVGTPGLDCVIAHVRCRTCLMINTMDNLTIDCEAFDDGLSNGSCP